MSRFGKDFPSAITVVLLAASIIAGAEVFYFAVYAGERIGGVRLLFDPNDIKVYFDSSRWVTEGGRLYREVPSEYPLLANLVFAAIRYVADLIVSGSYGFRFIWIISASLIYLCIVYQIARRTAMLAVFAWLAPAPIYFALFRFDLYPALATLISLFAIQRGNYIKGALWLGIATALKGYTLFLLPA